jgi:hypothetical protein
MTLYFTESPKEIFIRPTITLIDSEITAVGMPLAEVPRSCDRTFELKES